MTIMNTDGPSVDRHCPAEDFSGRVIIHVDLDCFYAQVEHKRCKIPRNEPLAVQQWDGLIAVNYPARELGVSRHMRVKEALKIAPNLHLVHVETIGDERLGTAYTTFDTRAKLADSMQEAKNETKKEIENLNVDTKIEKPFNLDVVQREQQQNLSGNAQAMLPSNGSKLEVTSNRYQQKACLERYRHASYEILQLVRKLVPCAVIEKASIDEFYIDVTAMIDREVKSDPKAELDVSSTFAWGSIVVGSGRLDPGKEFDRRLSVGAEIACRIRGALLEQQEYTSSAGIASNKLMAKLGSAMHKPNQQTIIPPRYVPEMMENLPIKKLRGLGGNLGNYLEDMGCITAGQVSRLPFEILEKRFGQERAHWISLAVRGKNNDPVEEKEKPKSLLAAKSFESTSDLSILYKWMSILVAELVPRMILDQNMYQRKARTLVLHFRKYNSGDRSRQSPLSRSLVEHITQEGILKASWDLFISRCSSSALPCCRLALSVGDFREVVKTSSSIARFFNSEKCVTAETIQNSDRDGNESSVEKSNKIITLSDTTSESLRTEGHNSETLSGTKHALPLSKSSQPSPKKMNNNDMQGEYEVDGVKHKIDISEQERLLKEAQLLSIFKRNGTQIKQRRSSKKAGFGKQMGIASFLQK